MPQRRYRDLAEFGLPLITPEDINFPALLKDMQSRPDPFGRRPPLNDTSAVLLNESGKVVIVLAYYWKYNTASGQTYRSHHSNLSSSTQTNVLAGRTKVVRDFASFFLPGSKRLITEEGTFGNNLDVLPPEAVPQGGLIQGMGRSGSDRNRFKEAITSVELQLDTVFFEDGLCAGPDESELFESVMEDLALQRSTAQQIVELLCAGASRGQVFDLLRPLGRRQSSGHGIRSMFSHEALHHLVEADDSQLLQWFEEWDQVAPLPLHRKTTRSQTDLP